MSETREPGIPQNASISITQLGNGYQVVPNVDYGRGRGEYATREMLAFESFEGLQQFLAKHFTHRNCAVLSDDGTK